MDELTAVWPTTPPPARDADWPTVKAWRQAARKELIAARVAIARPARRDAEQRIVAKLQRIVAERSPDTIGFYWPFKGEVDLRPLCRTLHGAGIRLGLPVVVEPRWPVEFRAWSPGTTMEHGVWQIPVPRERTIVQPDLLFVALVGFDAACYRLGYGGGYYDRTLAASDPRPFAVGVGFKGAQVATIHPQPHDIAMNCIVTEDDGTVLM